MTVQHRRHRAVYLAPTAVQHFSTKSYDSYGNETFEDDDEFVEDLRIPLSIEIPQDENLRLPITSPPSSANSNVLAPAFSHYEFPTEEPEEHPRGRCGQRLYKVFSTMYAVVSDFLLLFFVCVMGLFFHVEVQVVKERTHRRRGRVAIRKSSEERQRRFRHDYQSTDLLRPLHQASPSNSYLTPDDMV